jgi:lipopolysaccharide export system permease protein
MQPWKTLARYIARQFTIWCLGAFGAMIVIVFLLDYLELIRRGANHSEATMATLFEMAALKQPYMAQQIMPFAILFGTMIAFWRMTRSNELVVARAAGVSVWQFLSPAVLCALLIGVIAVTVFNPIASVMQLSYDKLESRVLSAVPTQLSLSRSGLWLMQSDGSGTPSVIHASRLAPGGITLEDVVVLFFDKSDRLDGRIDAKQARLDNGHWSITDGMRWKPGKPQEPFAMATVDTNMTPGTIEESFAPPETMSFWDLPGFISLLQQSGFSTQRHRLYYNALLARPFLLAAMVLIAATFSLRMQRRGGTTLMIASGIASGFILYFISNMVFALGLSSTIPVTLAAWTPAGVSWLAGASLLLHLEDG